MNSEWSSEFLVPYALEGRSAKDTARLIGVAGGTFYKRLREDDLRFTWKFCQAVSRRFPGQPLRVKLAIAFGVAMVWFQGRRYDRNQLIPLIESLDALTEFYAAKADER